MTIYHLRLNNWGIYCDECSTIDKVYAANWEEAFKQFKANKGYVAFKDTLGLWKHRCKFCAERAKKNGPYH